MGHEAGPPNTLGFGPPWLRHYNGTTWSRAAQDSGLALDEMTGDGSGGLWLSGSDATSPAGYSCTTPAGHSPSRPCRPSPGTTAWRPRDPRFSPRA